MLSIASGNVYKVFPLYFGFLLSCTGRWLFKPHWRWKLGCNSSAAMQSIGRDGKLSLAVLQVGEWPHNPSYWGGLKMLSPLWPFLAPHKVIDWDDQTIWPIADWRLCCAQSLLQRPTLQVTAFPSDRIGQGMLQNVEEVEKPVYF